MAAPPAQARAEARLELRSRLMSVQRVAATVLLVVLAMGCSSKSTPSGKADSGSPAPSDAGRDTGAPPADASREVGPTDAGSDSGIPSEAATSDASGDGGNPLVELASCLGMSQPITISGQMPHHR
jgi:hypothetical protein